MSSSELWLAGFRKRLLESAQSLTCWLLLVSLLERRLMVALFRFPLAPPPTQQFRVCTGELGFCPSGVQQLEGCPSVPRHWWKPRAPLWLLRDFVQDSSTAWRRNLKQEQRSMNEVRGRWFRSNLVHLWKTEKPCFTIILRIDEAVLEFQIQVKMPQVDIQSFLSCFHKTTLLGG